MIVSAPRQGAGERADPRNHPWHGLAPQVNLVEAAGSSPASRGGGVETPVGRFEGFESEGRSRRTRSSQSGRHFRRAGECVRFRGVDGCRRSPVHLRPGTVFDVLLRPKDPAAAQAIVTRLEQDKRLGLRGESETLYYSKQTMTAAPFRILGDSRGGHVRGCGICGDEHDVRQRCRPNPKWGRLGARILTAIGRFRFMMEGTMVALLGGMVGCGLALALSVYVQVRGVYFGTMDFQSFAETLFQFCVTPDLWDWGCCFLLESVSLEAYCHALRASRLPVIAAQRTPYEQRTVGPSSNCLRTEAPRGPVWTHFRVSCRFNGSDLLVRGSQGGRLDLHRTGFE